MKKILRNVIGGLGILMSNEYRQSYSQTNPVQVSLEGVLSGENEKTFVRPTIIKSLTKQLQINDYIEFYGDGNTYYGKATASYNVWHNFSAVMQMLYGTGFDNRYAAGLSVKYQLGNLRFKLHALPNFWEIDGRDVHRSIIGGSSSLDIPHKFKFGAFGEVNLDGKDGSEWSYGELSLERKIRQDISVGYNAGLYRRNVGNTIPEINHRLMIKWDFK